MFLRDALLFNSCMVGWSTIINLPNETEQHTEWLLSEFTKICSEHILKRNDSKWRTTHLFAALTRCHSAFLHSANHFFHVQYYPHDFNLFSPILLWGLCLLGMMDSSWQWLIDWLNEWIDCWYTLFSCPPCCLMDTFYLADKNLDAHGCQCFFFYSRKHNLCEHGYGTNAVVGSTSALEGIHLSSWSYYQLTGRQIQRYCDWSEISILLQ